MYRSINIDIDILSQLIPNPLTMLTQLCATAVLFYALYKLLWKPLKKIMDERSEYEQSKMETAQRIIEENSKNELKAKEMIENARKESEKIIEDAQMEGLKKKQELINEAQQQAKDILQKADQQAKEQKEKMMQKAQEEMVDVALLATKKMLQQQVEENGQVEEFIKEVKN